MRHWVCYSFYFSYANIYAEARTNQRAHLNGNSWMLSKYTTWPKVCRPLIMNWGKKFVFSASSIKKWRKIGWYQNKLMTFNMITETTLFIFIFYGGNFTNEHKLCRIFLLNPFIELFRIKSFTDAKNLFSYPQPFEKSSTMKNWEVFRTRPRN